MSPLEVGALAFACVFGAAMLGLAIGNALPDHHLSDASKDVVKVGTALVATMAALVMSLLISSAKSSWDRMGAELVENAARVIALDRALADYGPKTADIRAQVQRAYAARIDLIFPSDDRGRGTEDTPESVVRSESIRAALWRLEPRDDAQRDLRAEAIGIANQMAATRWLLLLQKDQSTPFVLLIVLVSWLAIVFATFGLFAPRNAMVVGALLVCALSVSGAILLILEMNDPFGGVMKLSSLPMRDALANLGH